MTSPRFVKSGLRLHKTGNNTLRRLPFLRGRPGRWGVAAVLVVAFVAVGFWFAASTLARGPADASRREFLASSAHVPSTLQLVVPGFALGILLGFLVWILGTGRSRARWLVDEKTRELRLVVGELETAHRVLVELNEERQRLLARTVEIAEAERMSLAADLHDGPIQHLTAVTLQLDLLVNKVDRGDLEQASLLGRRLREAVAGEMVSLRRLMSELRPPILEQRGIEVALRDCAQGVLEGQSIQFELECTLGEVQLVPELETAIYRVVREGLTNIRKHSGADHARVTLDASISRVLLTISDDGRGFEPTRANGDHFGLVTMREGVEAVGGTWRLDTRAGSGTHIEASLPWKRPTEQGTGEPEKAAA
jgi:two-component system sensor histidine kinase DegS